MDIQLRRYSVELAIFSYPKICTLRVQIDLTAFELVKFLYLLCTIEIMGRTTTDHALVNGYSENTCLASLGRL